MTGIGSPVTIDSSTAELPGQHDRVDRDLLARAGSRTSSPTTTSSTGISVSAPSRITRAVRACRPSRARMASPVPALARASISRPSRIRVMITPTASK